MTPWDVREQRIKEYVGAIAEAGNTEDALAEAECAVRAMEQDASTEPLDKSIEGIAEALRHPYGGDAADFAKADFNTAVERFRGEGKTEHWIRDIQAYALKPSHDSLKMFLSTKWLAAARAVVEMLNMHFLPHGRRFELDLRPASKSMCMAYAVEVK